MNTVIDGLALTKEFGNDLAKITAINNVNISIEIGEIAVIFGESGSGKTTLLSILGCVLTPDGGDLFLSGRPVKQIPGELARLRREELGFLFQSFNLLPYLTASENVAIAMKIAGKKSNIEIERRSKELLGEVGLSHRIDHYPSELSGGEQQRVSFARAIANEPQILFADEPTANLDSKQSENLMLLLEELQNDRQMTVVIVTHNQKFAKIADRIFYLHDGELVDQTLLANAVDQFAKITV